MYVSSLYQHLRLITSLSVCNIFFPTGFFTADLILQSWGRVT